MYIHITINRNEDGEPRIKYKIELQYTSVHMHQYWACIHVSVDTIILPNNLLPSCSIILIFFYMYYLIIIQKY